VEAAQLLLVSLRNGYSNIEKISIDFRQLTQGSLSQQNTNLWHKTLQGTATRQLDTSKNLLEAYFRILKKLPPPLNFNEEHLGKGKSILLNIAHQLEFSMIVRKQLW